MLGLWIGYASLWYCVERCFGSPRATMASQWALCCLPLAVLCIDGSKFEQSCAEGCLLTYASMTQPMGVVLSVSCSPMQRHMYNAVGLPCSSNSEQPLVVCCVPLARIWQPQGIVLKASCSPKQLWNTYGVLCCLPLARQNNTEQRPWFCAVCLLLTADNLGPYAACLPLTSTTLHTHLWGVVRFASCSQMIADGAMQASGIIIC